MKSKNRLRFDLTTEAGRSALQRFFPELFKTIPATATELLLVDALATHHELIATDLPYAAAVGARTAEETRKETDLLARANRQQAAANARAAKAAKQAAGPVEAVLGPAEDLLGPDGTNGEATGDGVDDLGLADPSMSPGEAKDAGLALVRSMYAAGKVTEVKALQKKWGVAKFYDVPVERAYVFYREALTLSHATMGAPT